MRWSRGRSASTDGSVSLPVYKLTTRGLEGYLDLPRRVESPRFRRIAPYTQRLFVHYFVLTDRRQLDAEFSGWIHEAYHVGPGSVVPPGE